MIKILSISIVMLAIFTFSFATFSSVAATAKVKGWENPGYGPDLYNLPHVGMVHTKNAWQKIDFGGDLYGFPDVTQKHGVK